MKTQHGTKICTVKLSPGGRSLMVVSGENLLTLLAENSILLRSDCGGRGVCGKCQVDIVETTEPGRTTTACTHTITGDCEVTIPMRSRISPHIIKKAAVQLPASFGDRFSMEEYDGKLGIAVDLGTTTIAVYLLDTANGKILSSLAVKNPQALYGDDVMSRIGYIGTSDKKLARLQHLVTGAIDWGVNSLLESQRSAHELPENMVIVGNPSMIHILLGISPATIGVAPYTPQFFSTRSAQSGELGLSFQRTTIRTLPQISGFIGGDILAAAVAVELAEQPEGTLLIDLGTNGELMLKGKEGFCATSCATGPAFEGATLSCGIQAVPGAIDRITINGDHSPLISLIDNGKNCVKKPLGICGSGIISGVVAFLKSGILEKSGAFSSSLPEDVVTDSPEGRRYRLYCDEEGDEVFISQKDIRHVQLGKAALISGIEFLLASAGMETPSKIIVAGAFGSHLNKNDLVSLGMVPAMDPADIHIAGNAAGAGAIMALCDDHYINMAEQIAARTSIINLAADKHFQNHFITRLSF